MSQVSPVLASSNVPVVGMLTEYGITVDHLRNSRFNYHSMLNPFDGYNKQKQSASMKQSNIHHVSCQIFGSFLPTKGKTEFIVFGTICSPLDE